VIERTKGSLSQVLGTGIVRPPELGLGVSVNRTHARLFNGGCFKVNTPKDRLGINRKDSSKRGRLVLSALAATMLVGSVAPAFSAAGIEINIAPPAPRVVEVPPPRPGFVWAPGYYRWDGHQHVWIDGHFMRERRGSHWVPEHWDERHGRYHFEPGHWERG
jgi:hypothetical protein